MAKKRDDEGDDRSQAHELVKLALKGAELFLAPDGQAYISRTVNGRQDVLSLGQHRFRTDLAARFMKIRKRVPNAGALNDAISVLKGLASQAKGPFPVAIRVGAAAGRIYVDLCNESREIVVISNKRWQIVRSSPVRFRRTRGMLALPRPVRGGSIQDLRRFLNVASTHDFILIVAWLLACLRPTGPFPVLVLHGEAGSAKSTSSRVLRALADPNAAAIRSFPHEIRDLMVAAANGWMVIFDNLSRLPPWLSDALCRLATGGGFAKRENYTDMEEILIDVQRPIIINGIDDMVTRGDLMDRALVLHLPRISKGTRQTEDEFWRVFEVNKSKILGVLLNGVVCALREIGRAPVPKAQRMADFEVWAVAALPALGLSPTEFRMAYEQNQTTASETVIDASPIGRHLRVLAEGDGFRGTANQLLGRVEKMADEGERRHWGWPRSPLQIANAVRRLAPVLARVGVTVRTGERHGRSGDRIITIRLAEPADDDD